MPAAPAADAVPSTRDAASYKTLFSFDETDGAEPEASLIDHKGLLYGTTWFGGKGCGVVFTITTAGKEEVIHNFSGDGCNASALTGGKKVLYGVTHGGGANGEGVVFSMTTAGKDRWDYSFKGAPDESAYGNLIRDSHGVLFGLAMRGLQGSAGGVVFLLAPRASETGPWTLQNIHEFRDTYPATNLEQGRNGVLYGDIYGDQDFNAGYVFQIEPPAEAAASWTYTKVVDFNGSAFQNPDGVLVRRYALFVTITGGGYSPGNIVSVTP